MIYDQSVLSLVRLLNMASFGRAIGSGVTNIAEIAANLVNINVNFAVHQVKAPVEFEGVGQALSHLRRTEAEAGRPHVTARILGALFKSLAPKTPKLLSLYGLRASDISRSPKVNPSQDKEYGFFSNRVGADATTVWAGATSGPEAIAVHLLACMLARIWDSSEATSIWMEIVKYQSENILNALEEGCMADFSDVVAAKTSLSRQQLAEWDASARAWLHAADRVKAYEQKQLMLILDNIHQRVNSAQGTFESVIKAWQDSLTVFEALVMGVSQKAKSGEILLALSAWHLYPDLMVVEPYPKTIKQKDPLLPSCAILTVGLHRVEEEQGGICWSLPLAQLRHYGAPVTRERTVNSTQRLTLEEFAQAFLGAFLHGWGDRGTKTSDMINWLQKVHLTLVASAKQKDHLPSSNLGLHETGSWLGILFDASEMCLQAFNTGDESPKQMLRLGRRYAQAFLGKPLQGPYFGLSEKGKFVSCTGTEDNRIQVLREAAAKLPGRPSQMFIRVRHEEGDGEPPVYEYMTAKPIERTSSKRHNDGSHQPIFVHRRWICGGGKIQGHTVDNRYFRKLVTLFPELGSAHRSAPSKMSAPAALTRDDDISDEPRSILPRCSTFISRDDPKAYRSRLPVLEASFEERSKRYQAQGEEVLRRENCTIEEFKVEKMGIFWLGYLTEKQSSSPWYEMIYGDESAALFADSNEGAIQRAAEEYSLTHFHNFFESDLLDPRALGNALYMAFASADHTRDYWRSLKAVSSAASLYRDLKIATIDVRVLERRFWESPWICEATMAEHRPKAHRTKSAMSDSAVSTDLELLTPYPLDLKSAFSCICFFESGRFQIQPKNLGNVMAMCSNDLIWVASFLLNDPLRGCLLDEHPQIRAFPGNIGRSGIAFMVAPVEPMRRPNTIHDFRDIIHRPFEGHLQNNFRTTSLHLSFTTAESPLGDNFSGMKDDEIYLLETLLAVHEGGEWVADLDVLSSFLSRTYTTLGLCEQHTESQVGAKLEACCIDNWAELLEPPEARLGVVRACGDWQARLATFTIAVSTGNKVVVLPSSICWDCVNSALSSENLDSRIVLIA